MYTENWFIGIKGFFEVLSFVTTIFFISKLCKVKKGFEKDRNITQDLKIVKSRTKVYPRDANE